MAGYTTFYLIVFIPVPNTFSKALSKLIIQAPLLTQIHTIESYTSYVNLCL